MLAIFNITPPAPHVECKGYRRSPPWRDRPRCNSDARRAPVWSRRAPRGSMRQRSQTSHGGTHLTRKKRPRLWLVLGDEVDDAQERVFSTGKPTNDANFWLSQTHRFTFTASFATLRSSFAITLSCGTHFVAGSSASRSAASTSARNARS